MSVGDLLFYVMDAVIIGMLVKMLMTCSKVEVEIKQGLRWLIPVLFMAIAVFSFIKFEGIFRYIQAALLTVMAVMYWFMKTGLTPDGIVMIGRFVPYKKAGSLFMDENDHTLHFQFKGSTEIYYNAAEEQAIREYLEAHHIKLAKKKKDGTTIQRVDPTANKKKF
ncbi:MAG: hypothetical protein LKF79_06430 [Solobacterium sp.]|jgi:hypothetical protein|nr:hypothetical protein [Solobacterium sp.]MCH4222625.1 hypothetical protein [Solobacterium sp.]MCH4266260.1 hypothetical protein [Solobacterium sp.]